MKSNNIHEQAAGLVVEVDAKVRQLLEKVVGPCVLELVNSEPSHFLDSSDAKLRFAALAKISETGVITQAIADRCEELAREDSDSYVRGGAVICLCKFYRTTNNHRIGRLFATIVYDAREKDDVRWVAYDGLGHLGAQLDLTHSPVAPGFCFPADIDWTWVNGFLKQKGNKM